MNFYNQRETYAVDVPIGKGRKVIVSIQVKASNSYDAYEPSTASEGRDALERVEQALRQLEREPNA
jgi:isoaspartyl peptidase/L-asparaginase-like protein (Ntn-hydrolase superfamily)